MAAPFCRPAGRLLTPAEEGTGPCHAGTDGGEEHEVTVVESAGLSVIAIAGRLHVTRLAASNLLNGNAGLSAEMAIRFEKAFGIKADTLMRMQSAHELAEARARESEIVVEAA